MVRRAAAAQRGRNKEDSKKSTRAVTQLLRRGCAAGVQHSAIGRSVLDPAQVDESARTVLKSMRSGDPNFICQGDQCHTGVEKGNTDQSNAQVRD